MFLAIMSFLLISCTNISSTNVLTEDTAHSNSEQPFEHTYEKRTVRKPIELSFDEIQIIIERDKETQPHASLSNKRFVYSLDTIQEEFELSFKNTGEQTIHYLNPTSVDGFVIYSYENGRRDTGPVGRVSNSIEGSNLWYSTLLPNETVSFDFSDGRFDIPANGNAYPPLYSGLYQIIVAYYIENTTTGEQDHYAVNNLFIVA